MSKKQITLSNNIQTIVTQFNGLSDDVGDLALLTTSTDSSIVDAINALVIQVDDHTSKIDSADSNFVTNIRGNLSGSGVINYNATTGVFGTDSLYGFMNTLGGIQLSADKAIYAIDSNSLGTYDISSFARSSMNFDSAGELRVIAGFNAGTNAIDMLNTIGSNNKFLTNANLISDYGTGFFGTDSAGANTPFVLKSHVYFYSQTSTLDGGLIAIATENIPQPYSRNKVNGSWRSWWPITIHHSLIGNFNTQCADIYRGSRSLSFNNGTTNKPNPQNPSNPVNISGVGFTIKDSAVSSFAQIAFPTSGNEYDGMYFRFGESSGDPNLTWIEVADRLAIPRTFSTLGITPTSGTAGQWAGDLTVTEILNWEVQAICQVAEHGYSVNDVIGLQAGPGGIGIVRNIYSFPANGPKVPSFYYIIPTTGITYFNKTTGATVTLTPANWKVYVNYSALSTSRY